MHVSCCTFVVLQKTLTHSYLSKMREPLSGTPPKRTWETATAFTSFTKMRELLECQSASYRRRHDRLYLHGPHPRKTMVLNHGLHPLRTMVPKIPALAPGYRKEHRSGCRGGFQDHGSEGVETMVPDHGFGRVGTMQVQAIMPPPWSSFPWCFDFPWSFLIKEIPWCFECFQLFLSVFLVFFFSGVQRGQKFLGVLGGFPWYLPKHQGKEDQGSDPRNARVSKFVCVGPSEAHSLKFFRTGLSATGKSHAWTNTSVGGNFRRTFRTIGPYEFPQEKVWTNDWSIWISPEISMDQWRSKFSESFSLDRYWSIECSSLSNTWNRHSWGLHLPLYMKWVQCGKLAFSQGNRAFLGPKIDHFRSFGPTKIRRDFRGV